MTILAHADISQRALIHIINVLRLQLLGKYWLCKGTYGTIWVRGVGGFYVHLHKGELISFSLSKGHNVLVILKDLGFC